MYSRPSLFVHTILDPMLAAVVSPGALLTEEAKPHTIWPMLWCLQRPVMAVKIVLGFVLKMAVYWPWLARDLFFCQSLEQSTLKR